mgnify:CR=1 FL=1
MRDFRDVYAARDYEIIARGPPFDRAVAESLLWNLQESWRKSPLDEYADDVFEAWQRLRGLQVRINADLARDLGHLYVPAGRRRRVFITLRSSREHGLNTSERVKFFLHWVFSNLAPEAQDARA